ncbi:hypothetical protein [Brevibacillus centrosporus]|uniref:Uncharacterized protein n=1 Tax=Brevibacillus centrosporus TaxID=54910 RepID=A0A1I3UIM9_9BACL|nr:hypothetical protein [Brevibacillus centrosporus]SFJ83368.1 hypothetical protein SAMN05518846_1068 [Brevibacillus centrosporus]
MNPLLKQVIWLLAKLVLAGMSREQAIDKVAKDHGLNQEELRAKLL